MIDAAMKRIVTDEEQLSVICKDCTIENFVETQSIIDDLLDTAKILAKNCAGLAANQLGYNLRVFVIKTRDGWQVFKNPTLSKAGPMTMSSEGCLSFPGKQNKIKRCSKITVKSMGKNRGLLTGIEAMAFQHELDHLNGKLI